MGLEPGGASWRPNVNNVNQVSKMNNDGRSAGGGTSYFAQGEGEEPSQQAYDEFTPSSGQEDDLALDFSLTELIKDFFNNIVSSIKKFFK